MDEEQLPGFHPATLLAGYLHPATHNCKARDALRIDSLRSRLPKGPRLACDSLDADTSRCARYAASRGQLRSRFFIYGLPRCATQKEQIAVGNWQLAKTDQKQKTQARAPPPHHAQ